MATTNYGLNVVGGLPKTARFDVTASNDVVLEAGNYIILAAYFNDTVTALNIGAVDITAYPATTADQAVQATTAGAGSVTIVYCELPEARYDTHDV
jgi:hypothetical protein